MNGFTVAVLVAPTQDAQDVVADWPVVLSPPGDLPGLVDVVPARTTHLLLVGEQRHEVLVRRHAALLSDRGVAVAHRSLPHGPAALIAMALQAAASGVEPGLVPTVLDGYAAGTWSGAWTPSVTKLAEPSPSMGQHLRSVFPSAGGFIAQLSPEPRVVKVGSRVAPVEASGRTTLLVSGAGIPHQGIETALRLTGATEQVPVSGLRLDPLERFGSARAVELVALPDAGVQVRHDPMSGWCDVCGAAVAHGTGFCSYCRVRPLSESLVLRGDR